MGAVLYEAVGVWGCTLWWPTVMFSVKRRTEEGCDIFNYGVIGMGRSLLLTIAPHV